MNYVPEYTIIYFLCTSVSSSVEVKIVPLTCAEKKEWMPEQFTNCEVFNYLD